MFERSIGIDYSGAETADSSCKGLRVATSIIAVVRLAGEPNVSHSDSACCVRHRGVSHLLGASRSE
jgi:hypothetical protein